MSLSCFKQGLNVGVGHNRSGAAAVGIFEAEPLLQGSLGLRAERKGKTKFL